MRIGLVSDIHGNAAGLARALDGLSDVDEIWCVGDAVSEHRFDNDVVAMLRERASRYVLGNHELGLLGQHGERARAAANPDLLEYVRAQPLAVDTIVEGRRLVMTHGSPLPPHNQYVVAGSPELRRLAEIDADIVILGHTHVPMAERIGRPLVVNPGSAGERRPTPHGSVLSFAVVDVITGEVSTTVYDPDA
jgi:putative phosphoesterase